MTKQLKDVASLIAEETGFSRQAIRLTERSRLPPPAAIPGDDPAHWIRIPGVIACAVAMEGAGALGAASHAELTARAHGLFTRTALRIFARFGSPSIAVTGEGAVALFEPHHPHTALAAVVSFKTFVRDSFTPQMEELAGIALAGHYGIDRDAVLVRRLAPGQTPARGDGAAAQWAGKPVVTAARLAGQAPPNHLLASDRFHRALSGEKALMSCRCGGKGAHPLWDRRDVSADGRFDFPIAYVLKADWCEIHGEDYCREILGYDGAGVG